jgi:hypothetical protein
MASERVAHLGGSGGKGGDTARSVGFQWTPEGMETLFIKSKVLETPGRQESSFLSAAAGLTSMTWRDCGHWLSS